MKKCKKPINFEDITIEEGDLVFLPAVGMCRVIEIFMDDDPDESDYADDWYVMADDVFGARWIERVSAVRRKPPSRGTLARLRAARHLRVVFNRPRGLICGPFGNDYFVEDVRVN